MNLKFFKKTFLVALILFPLCFGNIIHAADYSSISTLDLDTSAAVQDETNFGLPTKILVTPIFINSDKTVDTADWIKGIFSYTVDKLGFQDIPYHYLVTEDGTVYKANSSGDEKQVTIDTLGSTNVVVGYLDSSKSDFINPAASTALGNLLIDIANRNDITPDNIYFSGTQFLKDKATNTISIEPLDLEGNWKTSLSNIVDSVKAGYKPISKAYSISVEDITLPTVGVNPGDTVSISVKLKNSGSYGIYQGSNSEVVLTKNNTDPSNFYLNNVWLSQTQTSIMTSGEALLPGEEKTFTFQVKAPLAVGDYTETFNLKTFGGTSVTTDKNIDIKVTLNKTSKQIIQIKNNGYFYANVYSKPDTNSSILKRVTPGERYFLIDVNNDTLWAQIDLGDGTTGYLAVWQFSYL